MVRLMPADGSVSWHVSRLRVLTISPDAGSFGQFDMAPVLAAAELLADAHVDLILWNGTSSSWLGFDRDQALIEAVRAHTGIAATTAVVAINAALARMGAKRIGLVTPYVAGIEADIARNYAGIGIHVAAATRLDITDNFAFGRVPPARIAEMTRDVAKAKPDAIVIMCTNLAGAELVGPLGAELGIPILDSVEVAVSHCLSLSRAV